MELNEMDIIRSVYISSAGAGASASALLKKKKNTMPKNKKKKSTMLEIYHLLASN
jgi:hypothetical protein